MVKRERVKETSSEASSFEAFYRAKKAALAIERDALDDEWAQHASHYQDVVEFLSGVSGERDRLKEALRSLEGSLDPKMRTQLEDNGTKVTEAAVKAAVAEHRDVVASRLEIIDIDRQVALLSGLRESFAQRRYALQELSSLWLGSYWATPNAKPRTYESNRAALQEERKKR